MKKRNRQTLAASVLLAAAQVEAQDRVDLRAIAVDRYEVTIERFAAFSRATGRVTQAEREGGGHEWQGAWQRRAGWTFMRPFGDEPVDARWPAVHVSWFEARDFCLWAGGRLPSRSEWERAAYEEHGPGAPAGFAVDRIYRYPVGASADGANVNANDAWPRLAPVGATRQGVNGLYDMGGNAWEWLADRRDETALTAGGSWWYGAPQMQADAMQWKPASFYVAYVGFRCVYDRRASK